MAVFFNDNIKTGRGWEWDELFLFVIVLYFIVYLTLFLKTLLFIQGGYFFFFDLALYNYHKFFSIFIVFRWWSFLYGVSTLFHIIPQAFCYNYNNYYYYYFCLFAIIVCLFIHLISICNLCHWSIINWANYTNWLPQAGWEAVLSTNHLSWSESVYDLTIYASFSQFLYRVIPCYGHYIQILKLIF